MGFLNNFKQKKRLHDFRKLWRDLNSHNFTFAVNQFNKRDVHVGNGTYGGINVLKMASGGGYTTLYR